MEATVIEDAETRLVRVVRRIVQNQITTFGHKEFARRFERFRFRISKTTGVDLARPLIVEWLSWGNPPDLPADFHELADCRGDRWNLVRDLIFFAVASVHPSGKEVEPCSSD